MVLPVVLAVLRLLVGRISASRARSELRLRVLQKQLDELGEGEDGAAEAQQEVPQ